MYAILLKLISRRLRRRAEPELVTKEDIIVLKTGWLTDNVRLPRASAASRTDVLADHCILGRVRTTLFLYGQALPGAQS